MRASRSIWKPWTIFTLLILFTLYALAISNAVYELTSPATLSWHVVLRKAYSIIAFAIVGLLFTKVLGEHGHRATITQTTLAIAFYSGAIEIGQAFMGSHEGLRWNAFDVGCGAIGGALGALASRYPHSSKTG